MDGLYSLRLNDNEIKTIDALKNLVGLEILMLNNNQIVDIKPLENLPKLRDLKHEGNNIPIEEEVISDADLARYKECYQKFQALEEKPLGMTCEIGDPLEFGDMTFRLDEFDSFYDMLEMLEMKNFDEELLVRFPQYVALAAVDLERVQLFDSFGEYVLFVDTSSPKYPVVIFDYTTQFDVVYETFEEFYNELRIYE